MEYAKTRKYLDVTENILFKNSSCAPNVLIQRRQTQTAWVARGPGNQKCFGKKESPIRVLKAGEDSDGRLCSGWEVEGCTTADRAPRQKGEEGLGSASLGWTLGYLQRTGCHFFKRP